MCSQCRCSLEQIPPRCYRCHRLTEDFRTCARCRSATRLYAVRAATTYTDMPKKLIAKLKFYGARAASEVIAKALLAVDAPINCVVVPVPTATTRARQRGYDQAKLIAKELTRHGNLPYLDCLARSGQQHQVGSKRAQRVKQLKGSYRVKTGCSVQGLRVLLIDDVLTTGATLEAAAACLKESGAERVYGLVFAQA